MDNELESDFRELSVWAVRYALGRRTYVSFSVPQAIMRHMDIMSIHDLKVIVRDIDEYKQRYGHIADACDEKNWMHFKTICEDAIESKELAANNGTRKTV